MWAQRAAYARDGMGGLLDHIGRACREAREQAALRQIDVATAAGTTNPTISRFETHERQTLTVDDLVAAYARETGRSELQLWQRAIELWQSEE